MLGSGQVYRPPCRSCRLFKQIGMRSRAGQVDGIVVEPIDQHPIGGDVTVAEPVPGARQRVVPIPRLEVLSQAKGLDDAPEPAHVAPPLAESLDVPLECPGRHDGARPGLRHNIIILVYRTSLAYLDTS